jgi:hypothetical protein
VEVARFFLTELAQRNCPTAGVLVNQVHRCSTTPPDVEALIGANARQMNAEIAPSVMARLGAAHRRLRELAAMDQQRVEELKRAAGSRLWLKVVPRMSGEVHDLEGLRGLHQYLLESGSNQG